MTQLFKRRPIGPNLRPTRGALMVAAMLAALLSVGANASPAGALSTISITSTASTLTPNYDLTSSYGIGDWAYWQGSTGSPAAPSNEKSGANLIGSVTPFNGSGLVSSTSAAVYSGFDFTDGTSPVSGSALETGIFNLSSGSITGSGHFNTGVQLDVISPTADPFKIYVWGTAFRATARLTVTVGAASASDATLTAETVLGNLYTITVDPDTAGETVHLTMVHASGGRRFSRVAIQAVAVDTAPPANTAPTAVANGPYLLAVGDDVTFDASGSSDPESDPLTEVWTADGGTVTGETYTAGQTPGVYEVCLTVNDGVLYSDPSCTIVVVYDPTGGFVTGGGWIDSPAGAYTADESMSGKASFGFVAKYKKGANVPDGNTQFQFKAGDLNFHSSSYEWLVVAGDKAQFRGEGTINGEPGYTFMISADDDNPDTFRIQIWGDTGTVYDNGSQQSLSGGSIKVHKG